MSAAVETIHWVPVTERLPELVTAVLLATSHGAVLQGFLERRPEGAGAPVFRNLWPMGPDPEVTHWAAMPEGPAA
jgi:hypothetical protein